VEMYCKAFAAYLFGGGCDSVNRNLLLLFPLPSLGEG
jgi:hypothetical protein